MQTRASPAFAKAGVPDELARDIGLLPLMGVAPEIAQLARSSKLVWMPWR